MHRDTIGFAGLGFLWLVLSCLILIHFHDQFWWGPDEGVYAYVAQRFMAGDTIHKDLIDIHPGYGNFLNILAFAVFGEDLLSLRYPLVLLTLVQGAVVLWLLRRHGNIVAFIGAFAVTAFSFIQFLNPSANWHALAAFFALSLCLTKMRVGSSSRLMLAAFIVGVAFFTRQLNGVFLAIGLIAVLLFECREDRSVSHVPAMILGGVPLLGLTFYVISKGHLFGLLLIGIWPLLLLSIATFQARLDWGNFFRLAITLGAGFLMAGFPIALFMAINGAFADWLHDILFSALVISNQEFISARSYFEILVLALASLFQTGLVGTMSGVAWTALLLIFPVVGFLAAIRLGSRIPVSPTIILATVWACSALHYQIPVYLMIAVAPALLALLSLSNRPAVLAGVTALSVWAVLFQAARPIDQNLASIVASEAYEPYVASDLPKVSLRISNDSRARYAQIIDAIELEAGAGEPLMTIPMNPEINFMTARQSPVAYYGTQLGLKTSADVEAAIASLDKAAPLFVVYKPNDKYLTPLGADLLKAVQARSPAPRQLGSFELYRYPARRKEPSRAHAPMRPVGR